MWSIISGEDLGTLTSNGLSCTFTPKTETGTAIIQVKTVDGEFTATCTVTVKDKPAKTDLTDSFTWTPGTVAYKTGSVSSTDQNWVYSNKVDVSEFSSITFSHIQTITTNTSLGYAFYDQNGNYISGASNAGVSYTPVEKTLDVPSGAKYFRVMWINTIHTSYDAGIHDIETAFYCYGNQ